MIDDLRKDRNPLVQDLVLDRILTLLTPLVQVLIYLSEKQAWTL